MNELILICTVGLPRSGKSTWARDRGIPIVNPDSIRLALHGQRYQVLAEDFVWAIAKVMVRALFTAGHSAVIVDATNTTRKRRDFWQDKGWNTEFKRIGASECVNTALSDFGLCIERAKAEGDADILPVFKRMADQYEPLDDDEVEYAD